ncbi:MAG: family 16 glycoside hydrolase [Candidatus Zipacnadales bacterium]
MPAGLSLWVATFALLPIFPRDASAAEIGALQGAGFRGIGLYVEETHQFTLQPQAQWGGYTDRLPRPINGSVVRLIRPIPVGGFHRDTWQLASLYSDHFSARFTGTLRIETEGDYTFYFQSDDGCRVWIDDQLIMDDWVPRPNLTSEKTIHLNAGEHPVRCEYMEIGGAAQAHFRWKGPGFSEQVVPSSVVSADGQPGWRVEYFLNEQLQGEPKTVHEEVIDLDWGDGGPAVYGGGPPIAEMDWVRPGDTYVIGLLRGPETARVGLVVQAVGATIVSHTVWGDDLVSYATSTVEERPIRLRVRVLSKGAAFALSDPTAMPGVWMPPGEPLLFIAGLGELPKLSVTEAQALAQRCMDTGLNAPFPTLSPDGWAYLFNGRNLNKWHLRNPDGPQSWSVENGELVNAGHGTDLISEFPLTDCQLHVEFCVPKDSNSGVYLQGRYEVQVHDSFGLKPEMWTCGSIYGQVVASENAYKPANEWQTFDIVFRGARPKFGGGLASPAQITVLLNGKTIVDHAELSGVTGGALDTDETRAQGIFLQGDHGAIRFRNIRVKPLQRSGVTETLIN